MKKIKKIKKNKSKAKVRKPNRIFEKEITCPVSEHYGTKIPHGWYFGEPV